MNAVAEFPSLLDELAGPVGVKLALALLHFVWQGVLIAAVAAVLMRLVGRRSSQRRYVIGVTGILLMAVAPVVTFCLVAPPESPPIEPLPLAEASNLLVDLEQIDMFLMTIDEPSVETPVIAPQAVRLSWPERLRLIQPYAVLLWLAGSLLCGLRLVVGAYFSRKCRRGRRAVPDAWLAVVVKTAARIGIKRPQVFVSDRVAEAIAVGLLRPMVLLPAAWIGRIPPDVLEAVLAHELAHLRRYDLWVNLFQRVVESLLFYHPAVWWLSRRVRLEREYCCDETAAAAVTGRAAYARALEYVATERVAGGRTELFQAALAAGMRGEDSMALLNRVHRVLGNEARPRRIPRLSEGLLALAVPVALWAAVVTIGPALAQEDSVEAAEPDAAEEAVVLDPDFGTAPEENNSDGNPEDGFTESPNGELHDALRELREELKSLRSEVEELRAGKKESQTDPTEIDENVVEWLRELNAAAAARDEALERSLDFESAKNRDPEKERLLREQLRDAQQRLEEIYESLKGAGFEPPSPPPGVGAGAGDHHYEFRIEKGPNGESRIKSVQPETFGPAPGVNEEMPAEVTGKDGRRYRAVTEAIETNDGRTIHFKRFVPVYETPSERTLAPPDTFERALPVPKPFDGDEFTTINGVRYRARMEPHQTKDGKTIFIKQFGPVEPRHNDDAPADDPFYRPGKSGASADKPFFRPKRPTEPEGPADEPAAEFAGPTNKPSAARQTPDARGGSSTRADGASTKDAGGKPAAPGATGGLSTRADGPSAHDTGGKPPVTPDENFLETESAWKEWKKWKANVATLERVTLKTESDKRLIDARQKLSEAGQRLAELGLAIQQPDGTISDPEGRKYRIVTDRYRGKDGETFQLQRYIPVDDEAEDRHSSNASPNGFQPPGATGGLSTRADGASTKDAGGKPAAPPDDVTTALEKPVSLHFEKTPLTHVLATLRNIADINIIVDEQGLMEEGVSLETPVSVNVDNLPIREVLSTILMPLNLTATTDDNTVEITSVQRSKGPRTVKIYPVADLVLPVQKLLELGDSKSQETSFPSVVKEQMATNVNALQDLISGTIEPGSWHNVGGQGVIRWNTATLSFVVRQTNDVHNEIAALLQRMRRMKSNQVQVPGQSTSHNGMIEDMRDATLAWQLENLREQLAALPQSPNATQRRQALQRQIERIESMQDEIAAARRRNDHRIRDTSDKINRKHFTPKNAAADAADERPSPADKTTSVKVRVEQSGTYYVDGYAANATGLASAIEEATADGNRPELVIQADRAAPYTAVVRVVEAAKELGIDKVRFATEPESPATGVPTRKHDAPAEAVPSDEKPDGEAKQDDQAESEFDRLNSEYNDLIEQRNFAEAITIAKKLRELDPQNEAAVTMLYKAKVLLEETRQPSDRPISTEALFDSTLEIEPVPGATDGLPTRR